MSEKIATSIHFCGRQYPVHVWDFLKGHTRFRFFFYSLLERRLENMWRSEKAIEDSKK